MRVGGGALARGEMLRVSQRWGCRRRLLLAPRLLARTAAHGSVAIGLLVVAVGAVCVFVVVVGVVGALFVGGFIELGVGILLLLLLLLLLFMVVLSRRGQPPYYWAQPPLYIHGKPRNCIISS